ncbi:MAG: hypothetical protein AAFX79_12600 [Planctomycetota bacterium]
MLVTATTALAAAALALSANVTPPAAATQDQDQPQAQPAAVAAPDPGYIHLPEGTHGFRGFDRLVLGDYRKAAGGDAASLASAIATCERAMAADATNAEARAWRGALRVLEAGQAYQQGDLNAALDLLGAGMADMEAAKQAEEMNPGVMLIRGSVLINVAQQYPDPDIAADYARRGVHDVSNGLLRLHDDPEDWAKQPASLKGPMLLAAAQGYELLGNRSFARDYYNRVIGAVPGTQWGKAAQDWIRAEQRRDREL